MSAALLAARPAPLVNLLAAALVERGLAPATADPSDLHGEDAPVPELRVAVWVGQTGLPADDAFAADTWELAVQGLEDAFRVLRAAAAGMHRLDPVDGERGVVVLVASRAEDDPLAHETVLAALAGMTFAAARDLADLKIRVVALVRDDHVPDRDERTVALVLHALDNPMLNGLVLRARGRVPGGW